MRWTAAVVFAAAQMGLTCGTAFADSIVIDQAFLPSHLDLFAQMQTDVDAAQTFTVGISGLLRRIDVLVVSDAGVPPGIPVDFDVRPTVNGAPVENDGLALASGVLSTATSDLQSAAALVSIQFGALGVAVQRGDVLALVLSSPVAQTLWWGRTNGRNYARGALFARSASLGLPTFEGPEDADLAFRTWVDPAPVPEPSALLFVGTGLAALLAGARRHSRISRNTAKVFGAA
jgi:hypothetical protein